MKVLVLNCGSSSIKSQLIDLDSDVVMAKCAVAKIGEPSSSVEYETPKAKMKEEMLISTQKEALDVLIGHLTHPGHGVIHGLSEISAVGHRVVHGGARFTQSTLITKEVIEKIREYIPLAPLHNPHNLGGIETAMRLFPGIPQVAVFDTAFHQTLPEKAYLYSIPFELYERYGVRKYGFHGTSCRYVSQRAAEIMGRPLSELKIVVCHLGNGVTIDAIDGGKSVDTSMGFTPVEGLMMGTRSGDIDPGVIYHLSKVAGLNLDQIYEMLNTKSGLLGVSGVSNDMKAITEQAEKGNSRCQLAVEMFAYRVRKYIGAYTAVLDRLDALVFTAGIGSNSPLVRSMIAGRLHHLGVEIDERKNRFAVGTEADLSRSDSRVRVMTIPTNEEKLIAMDTRDVVVAARKTR